METGKKRRKKERVRKKRERASESMSNGVREEH